MDLKKKTYNKVRGDLVVFKKAHLNKKDQLQNEKKKNCGKATHEEEDDALDEDERALIVVESYKDSEIKEGENQITQKKSKMPTITRMKVSVIVAVNMVTLLLIIQKLLEDP